MAIRHTRKRSWLGATLLWQLLLFSVFAIPAWSGVNDGLAAYYPFNGNANDESGHGNHGTVTAATLTADRKGTANSAYYFNGQAQIVVPHSDSLNLTGGGQTLAAWVKLANPANNQKIISKYTWPTRSGYILGVAGGGFGSEIATGPSSNDGTGFTPPIIANQWLFIAITRATGGKHRAYTNGQLSSEQDALPGDIAPNTMPLRIGVGAFSATNIAYWTVGAIDEVRIYNRALSQAEIQELYSGVAAPPLELPAIADQTATANTPLVLNFVARDPSDATRTVTVTATSSNQALVPDANLTITGSGENRTLTITPPTDQTGTVDITVTASDGVNSASDTFTVTIVAPVPELSPFTDQTVTGNTPLALDFVARHVATVTATSSNQTLLPDANLAITGTGENRTLTISPPAYQDGAVEITVTGSDGQQSTTQTFSLTIAAEELEVAITPQEAVVAGAQWRVDGGEWIEAGKGVTGLSQGEHSVEFKELAGWSKPPGFKVYTYKGLLLERSGAYRAVPAFAIGAIPPISALHGETVEMKVSSSALGAGATLTATWEPAPQGVIAFDPASGQFSYWPDPNDKTPFTVTFGATAGSESVQQVVTVEPRARQGDEQHAFGLATAADLPPADDEKYLTITEIKSTTPISFNNLLRETRSITVSGKKMVFEPGNTNGLYNYHGNDDISDLTIHAETLIIRGPLHLPQTRVKIHARELRFEDNNGHAYIKTTPRNLPSRPTTLSAPGAHGLTAGTIEVNADAWHADPGNSVRFILDGGAGQPGGNGKPGDAGHDPATIAKCWVVTLPKDTSYAYLWLGITSYKCGNEKDLPGNGSAATPAGISGNGGNGANLTGNVASLESSMLSQGGLAGASDGAYAGGRAGKTVTHYFEGSIIPQKTHTHSASPGAPALAPTTAVVGQAGRFIHQGNALSWLTPFTLQAVLAHARDAYLKGHLDFTRQTLANYLELIRLYERLEGWQTLPAEWQLELSQGAGEIEAILYRIDSHLDYFGNPAGWVPMLSFEVAWTAFEREIQSSIDILYLSYWIENSSATLTDKVNAMATAREKMKGDIDLYRTEYDKTLAAIPSLELEFAEVSNQSVTLQSELKMLEADLIRRAENTVEKRHEVPWWKKAAKIAGGLCKVLPIGQPGLAGVGFGLDLVSSYNPDEPMETLMAIPDGIQDFNKFKGTAKNWQSKANAFDQPQTLNFEDKKTGELITMDNCVVWDHMDDKNVRNYAMKELQGFAKPMGKELAKMASVFQGTEVPKGEVQQVLAELKAKSPEFREVSEKIATLLDRKETLGRNVAESTQLVQQLANDITQNMLAIDGLDRAAMPAYAALDARAMMYLKDMEQRARERLVRYHYYMAKAYEYRTLQPYTGELDLLTLFDKFKQMAASDTVLTSDDYTALKSLYQDELAKVADSIFTDFVNDSNRERATTAPLPLNQEELDTINAGKTLALNLKELDGGVGIFNQGAENIRIVGITVTGMGVQELGVPNRTDQLTLNITHSGVSKLEKEGEIHLFRHYNDQTDHPITWGANYFSSQPSSLQTIAVSPRQNSLLKTLLGLVDGADPTDNDDLLLYSRPAGWADLYVSRTIKGVDKQITSLWIAIEYDFTPKAQNPDYATLAVRAPEAGRPPVLIDVIDNNQRQDGAGDFYRSYPAGQALTLTAPLHYGKYTFESWTDASGLVLNAPAVQGMRAMGAMAAAAINTPVNTTLHLTLTGDTIVVPKYVYDPEPDDDHDALPDWWEMEYFQNLDQTGSGNYDGDGFSNAQELAQGTDPTKASVILPPDPPQVSGTSPTNNSKPTWTWTSGEHGGNGTFRYKRNNGNLATGATITTATSFTPTTALVQGTHTLNIQEQDAAGNWSASGSFAIVIDTTRPDAPHVSGNTPTNNTKPIWSWTSGGNGGNGTFRFKRNNANLTTGATETTDSSFAPATALPQGSQTLYVQERDAAGNWSATASFAIVIDTTRPKAPLVSGITPTNSTTPTWSWTSGGGGNAAFRYKRNSSNLATGATITNVTAFTPSTALTKGTHTLYVQERDAAGNWSVPGAFAIVIDPTLLPPAAPTSVTATYASSVALRWTDVADNELGFRIFRQSNLEGTYTQIGETGPDSATFADSTTVANATYTYYVAAYNGAGTSASAPVTITTGDIHAPDQVVAKLAVSGLRVNLSWRDNSSSEEHYQVRRIVNGDSSWTTVANLGPNTVAFVNTALTPRLMYTYQVCATGLDGTEECSDPVTVNGPTALKAVKNAAGVNLTWADNADDESGFRVYRRKSTEVVSTQIGSDLGPDTVAFTDSTAAANTTYLYAVEAFTSVGSATTPIEARITTGTITPPASFKAVVAPGSTTATLTWVDKSAMENGFALWRRAEGEAEWSWIKTTAANTKTMTDTGLSSGLLYNYQVCATTLAGGSACSPEAGVNGPTALQAPAPAAGSVNLTWQDNASDESGFIVYRRPSTATGMTALATLGAGSTTFLDSKAAAASTYLYQVCAFNSATDSCGPLIQVVVP